MLADVLWTTRESWDSRWDPHCDPWNAVAETAEFPWATRFSHDQFPHMAKRKTFCSSNKMIDAVVFYYS